jgi:membrane protein
LLLWIYYSAQIFLLGAEFTRVVTYEYGSRRPSRASSVAH